MEQEEKKVQNNDIEVVAARTRAPKFVVIFAIIGYSLSIGCILGGMLYGLLGGDDLYWTIAPIALGVILFFLFTQDFCRLEMNRRNRKLKRSLIDFDKKRNVVILRTISGKDIEINKNDFVDVSRNFWNDYVVIVKARVNEKEKNFTLGYSTDVPKIREFFGIQKDEN